VIIELEEGEEGEGEE